MFLFLRLLSLQTASPETTFDEEQNVNKLLLTRSPFLVSYKSYRWPLAVEARASIKGVQKFSALILSEILSDSLKAKFLITTSLCYDSNLLLVNPPLNMILSTEHYVSNSVPALSALTYESSSRTASSRILLESLLAPCP